MTHKAGKIPRSQIQYLHVNFQNPPNRFYSEKWVVGDLRYIRSKAIMVWLIKCVKYWSYEDLNKNGSSLHSEKKFKCVYHWFKYMYNITRIYMSFGVAEITNYSFFTIEPIFVDFEIQISCVSERMISLALFTHSF
jgi:hypothetical protein